MSLSTLDRPAETHPDPVPAPITQALASLDRLLAAARTSVAARIEQAGAAGLDIEQPALHGLAWLATTIQALHQMQLWHARLGAAATQLEHDLLRAAFGEYLAQIRGGLPMSPTEFVRLPDLGLTPNQVADFATHPAIDQLITEGTAPALRLRIAAALGTTYGDPALDDPALLALQDQVRRFATEQVEPYAHEWHLKDELIPMAVIDQMSEMGVFGLTIPEEYGGLGLGKLAMCLVSEELSRAYIGVGSLGTRSEIAGELILRGGTPEQKAEVPPQARLGRDPAHRRLHRAQHRLRPRQPRCTRAVRDGDTYRVTGAKTWITHGSRSDLMTLLVRTGAPEHRL